MCEHLSLLNSAHAATRNIIIKMTADAFREILCRAPFEPFRVVMSSGESYNVVHPETAFVTAKALVLALPDPTHADGERLAFCSYLHVAQTN